MNDGSHGAGRGALAGSIVDALAAAEVPPSKFGPARTVRLAEPDRELYFWILREFATNGRPGSEAIRKTATELGIDWDRALETLAHEDLIHRGSDGEIAVAYPFSGRPTAHRVRFGGGHVVDAMCALDALGIAPMFGQAIEIESRDPVTGEEIEVQVAPNGATEWRPASAMVVFGAIRSQDAACFGCCPVLNFFASQTNAEHWLVGHPEVRGNVISVPEAAAAGRAVFGDVFAQP